MQLPATKHRSLPVLVPLSRSLQRFAADPDFFAKPRVLLAANISPIKEPGTDLAGQVFIAFSDSAKQLEVISFNEGLGRFEFQIVRDFGNGKEPKIFYARRDACLTCHRGRAPIFPGFPWLETNSTEEVAAAIKITAGNVYAGISVDQSAPVQGSFSTANDADDFQTESLGFENLVLMGSGRLNGAVLWRQLWQRIPPAARPQMLAKALAISLAATENLLLGSQASRMELEFFRELFNANAEPLQVFRSRSIFDGVSLGSQDIPSLAKSILNRKINHSDEDVFLMTAAQGLATNLVYSQSLSMPFLEGVGGSSAFFLGPLASLLPTDAVTDLIALVRQDKRLSAFEQLLALFGAMAERCSEQCIFNGPAVNREAFARELALVTRGAVKPRTIPLKIVKLPRAEVEPRSALRADQATDDRLAQAINYCGRCHSSPDDGPRMGLLLGFTEEEVRAMFVGRSRDIRVRLLLKGDQAMPPPGSIEGNALLRNPAHRSAIEALLSPQ